MLSPYLHRSLYILVKIYFILIVIDENKDLIIHCILVTRNYTERTIQLKSDIKSYRILYKITDIF